MEGGRFHKVDEGAQRRKQMSPPGVIEKWAREALPPLFESWFELAGRAAGLASFTVRSAANQDTREGKPSGSSNGSFSSSLRTGVTASEVRDPINPPR
jgi:hypothetical protein